MDIVILYSKRCRNFRIPSNAEFTSNHACLWAVLDNSVSVPGIRNAEKAEEIAVDFVTEAELERYVRTFANAALT